MKKENLEAGKEAIEWETFNINHYIKVKLKEQGYIHYMDSYNRWLPEDMRKPLEHFKSKADKDGYCQFQAWDFIKMFGGTINPWDIPIFETDIQFKITHQAKQATPVKRDEDFKKIKHVAQCAFNSATQIEGSMGFEHWWKEEQIFNKWLRELPTTPASIDKSNEAELK